MAKHLILGLMLSTILALVVGCGGGSGAESEKSTMSETERVKNMVYALQERVKELEYEVIYLHWCAGDSHEHPEATMHPETRANNCRNIRTTSPFDNWNSGKPGEVYERLNGREFNKTIRAH